MTWCTVDFQTPVFREFTYETSCPQPTLPCRFVISDNQKNIFRQNIESAIRNSNRLGKLSNVYQSVMRFRLYIINNTTGFIEYSKFSKNFLAPVQCGQESFNHGFSKKINNDFVLSDTTERILNESLDFIQVCFPYVAPNDLKNFPPIPPNTEVIYGFDLRFLPVLSIDLSSWIMVYIFNLLVALGILPIIRTGYHFISNGFNYFKDSKGI